VTLDAGISSPTLPFVGFGVAFLDIDNDADLDLSIVNGHVIDNTAMFRAGSTHTQRKLLFQNTNGRRFAEVSRQSGSGFARDDVGRTLLAGDLDNDGDIDLVVTNNGGATEILRNNGGTGRNSIEVRVVGSRSNRDGLGTRMTVTAAGRTQVREVKSGSSYLGQNDLRVHVGLGEATRVERIDLRWPAGTMETIRDVPANQIVTITEGKGITGRSPYSSR
jgi:hypothetical protein